jgi:hypothetical protein
MFDDKFHIVAKRENIFKYNKSLKFTGGGTDFFAGVEGIMREVKQASDNH